MLAYGIVLFKAFRPLFAWLAAVWIGAAIGVALIDLSYGSWYVAWGWELWRVVGIFGMIGSAPFALITIYAAHHLKLPRPWADVAGSLIAVLTMWFLFTNFRLPGFGVLAGGFCAGMCYWLAAGRPRPPYA